MDLNSNAISFLCNSPLRLRILDALDGTQMDLRDLMIELESPRSTLQRNLSQLEKRDWIEDISIGYTTTTVGSLLLEEFVAMDKNIDRIESLRPFLDALDTATDVAIDRLEDPQITVIEPGRPDAPTTHLLEMLESAEHIRGILPIVSSRLIDRYDTEDTVPDLDIVLSASALKGLHERYEVDVSEWVKEKKTSHRQIFVYEGELPYGLLLFEEKTVFTAYDDVGRMIAVVDSSSEETVVWGEQLYEKYKCKSKQFYDVDWLC